MNCYKFNAFFDKLLTNENLLYFHSITSGHYWRNSQILELSILYFDQDQWKGQTWTLEKENDEYDMLVAFSEALSKYPKLLGYNCNSFHVPYLENKYKAYGLLSPFENKEVIDKFKEIKVIGKNLHISTKIDDLRIFLNIPEEASEIECIAYSERLLIFDDILTGNFEVLHMTKIDESEYLVECRTELEFPNDIRIHQDDFYLIGTGNSLKIKLNIIDGLAKLYYPNYKDYYYLPDEDMILHKSLASTIPKNKKVKATKDNCYTYIHFEETMSGKPASLYQFLVALLNHYKQK